MATIYKVDCSTRKPIFIGVQEENESNFIQFDITPWVEKHGAGVATANAKAPNSTEPYPVIVQRDGNIVTWKPKTADVAIEGVGAFQLIYTVGEVVARTQIWTTNIGPSLIGSGDPPDPISDYIDEMREIAAETLTYSQNAEESADAAAASAASIAGVTSEVANIRIGSDGIEYKSAGDSVRGQVDALASATAIKTSNLFNEDASLDGKLLNSSDGSLVDDASAITTGFIPIPQNKSYVDACSSWNGTMAKWTFVCTRLAFYDVSKTFISIVSEPLTAVSIASGAKYVRVSFAKAYGYKYICFSDATTLPVYEEYGYKNKSIETITADDIADGLIDQKKLEFAEIVKPTNLFDYTSEDMRKPTYWYYSTTIGSVVQAETNQYTTNYTAVKIPTLGASQIYLKWIPATSRANTLYWIGAVDSDMKLLSYQVYSASLPFSYNLPTGTAYVLCSFQMSSANPDFPTLMASSEETDTYKPYVKPYYVLKDCKSELDDGSNDIADFSAKLKLPNSYALVVGDTFQLFYKGIIDAVDPYIYIIDVQCSIGSAFSRYYEATPTTAGTYNLTISLKDYAGKTLDSKTVSLVVKAKATSPSAQKNVLCVGDSLSTEGTWCKEVYRRLTASDGNPVGDGLSNINFIGTRESGGVHYEGYGGWTFTSYNTENVSANAKVITCTHDKTEAEDQHSIYQASNGSTWKLETISNGSIKILLVSGNSGTFPASGTLTWVSGGANHSNIVYSASANAAGNPFWDSSANKVDFAEYATDQGVSSIDFVYVLLGWNDASTTEETYKQNAQTFIDNVHASFPNAKIVLVGLEIPARDGLGFNYGATGVYSKYWGLMQYVFNLDDWYDDLASDNTNVYHINLAGQFDTENNMMTTTVKVNTRNSKTVEMQSNGVHPATSGQMQIADAVYRDITSRL